MRRRGLSRGGRLRTAVHFGRGHRRPAGAGASYGGEVSSLRHRGGASVLVVRTHVSRRMAATTQEQLRAVLAPCAGHEIVTVVGPKDELQDRISNLSLGIPVEMH